MKRLLFIAAVSFLLFSVWRLSTPIDPSDTRDVTVTVDPGSSVSSIAELLFAQNLIRSPFFFKTYARITGRATALQAGTFSMTRAFSTSEIIRILHQGEAQQLSVSIPEGFTVADIDALLASRGFGKKGDIIDCAFHCNFDSFEFLPLKHAGSSTLAYGSRLEGYLFPETYAISLSGYVPKFFLERLLGEFRTRVVNAHAEEIRLSGHTLHEVITMASLIEEESRNADERFIVSGILWKRLKNRVVLGVDATTRYETGKKTDALTKAELEADSLYNTRRKQGLPPGPIANPGISSILASLQPKESIYWYYLHGKDGSIHYAETAEGHTANKMNFLR